MLEDRIIVQDRGIDAGLAALMQNANKGSMDPAALLAMMNNNGMGGNGGWENRRNSPYLRISLL